MSYDLTSTLIHFMTQHVSFPTHSSGTQPDLVLSSNPELVIDVEGLCNLGVSDHNMLKISIFGQLTMIGMHFNERDDPKGRETHLSAMHEYQNNERLVDIIYTDI